jgi:hypothetical protein
VCSLHNYTCVTPSAVNVTCLYGDDRAWLIKCFDLRRLSVIKKVFHSLLSNSFYSVTWLSASEISGHKQMDIMIWLTIPLPVLTINRDPQRVIPFIWAVIHIRDFNDAFHMKMFNMHTNGVLNRVYAPNSTITFISTTISFLKSKNIFWYGSCSTYKNQYWYSK